MDKNVVSFNKIGQTGFSPFKKKKKRVRQRKMIQDGISRVTHDPRIRSSLYLKQSSSVATGESIESLVLPANGLQTWDHS